jgi:tRNA/tmRNA/rRNA uracil-C5-methylase (TrmA/RlmC/RlmD family)
MATAGVGEGDSTIESNSTSGGRRAGGGGSGGRRGERHGAGDRHASRGGDAGRHAPARGEARARSHRDAGEHRRHPDQGPGGAGDDGTGVTHDKAGAAQDSTGGVQDGGAQDGGAQRPDAAPSWFGRRIEVEVGPVAHGGHCVARAEGRVVFVRHTLPGERVVAEITEDHGGSFCRADAVEVLSASPDRVTAPCALARPGGCGGCDWQHVTPSAQRALKSTVVAEQLLRLAGIEMAVEVEELPGGPLHWRTRTRLAVGRDGRAGLRAHRSHRVLALQDCPISVSGLLDGVVDRTWPAGVEIETVADDAGRHHVAQREPVVGTRRWRTRWRHGGRAEQHAADRTWRLRADGFWQVHPAAAETLAEVVGQWAQAPVGGRAWDLYGGVGLFAAVLAEQVGVTGSVLMVESARTAVADAESNLADLPQVRCVADWVERAIVRDVAEDAVDDDSVAVDTVAATEDDERPDVVVLDPPRKGAGRAVVDAIASRSPERIVYVACDPAALARDLATFAGHGYRLARLRAFDAFPMTHHVECVALLTK